MTTLTLDKSSFGINNKIARIIWRITYLLFFRLFVLNAFAPWRCFLLRVFGARIGENTNIHPRVKIWAPWNLEIGSNSSIGPCVDIYNQGKIIIGDYTIISQKSYLCASSHDFTRKHFPLVCRDIHIGNLVWIAADAFVAPGKKVGEGAVVAARSSVFIDVEPWTVVGGNPAKFLKVRELENHKRR
jgi:putative colanic acid biosynthesis acetyltransferase WcaF